MWSRCFQQVTSRLTCHKCLGCGKTFRHLRKVSPTYRQFHSVACRTAWFAGFWSGYRFTEDRRRMVLK